MRIVIDMQGAQTASRFRGIGRYALSFAKAVVRNRGEHEVLLALNGLLPDSIEPIRAAFDDLMSQDDIRVWQAPGPVRDLIVDNTLRREDAELVREGFLASLRPDIIHITSLFEGYADDAVTSIGRFDKSTPVTATLYDLIPLLNPDHYLAPDPAYAAHYHRKIASLNQSHTLLAISECARLEGANCLGIDAKKIINVSAAVESEFCDVTVNDKDAKTLTERTGVIRPFVLYTGGTDDRKNLHRLIEAWSIMPPDVRSVHQLLLAGNVPEDHARELRKAAQNNGLQPDELLFSGYLSDEDLIRFYNLCKLFIFPSWHEGFGLPPLEAMSCGAPTIGSNTSSIPEVIDLGDALFNPFDVSSIAKKIEQALTKDDFREALRQHGINQAKKFSWDATAKKAISAWIDLDSSSNNFAKTPIKKPRLAFVSPLPPLRTGIADYSAEILAPLSAYYDIELVVTQELVDSPWANQHGNLRDVPWLRSNANKVDRVLYQMGNSPYHRHMLSLLEDIPGVVVLHDFYMSSLMAWLETKAGEAGAWTTALYTSHGYGAVRDRFRDPDQTKLDYPANWHLLQHARGLIVHSEYSSSLVRQWYSHEAIPDWEVIPLLRTPPLEVDKKRGRERLGIQDDDFIVCSFGFLDATKLNHRLLNAWLQSKLVAERRCHLVFVGENDGTDYGENLLRAISESGFDDRIRITGFASPEQFQDYLAAADIAVQLRASSRGETSAAALDCMNHALPLIVNANGTLSEIDQNAAWILPDDFSDSELVDALEALWRDSGHRQTLGNRAQGIIHSRHAPAECARRYAAAIERFHQRSATTPSSLIRAIAATGAHKPNDEALTCLSKEIATSLPLRRPAKRIFLDVTATSLNDLKTGIERVARAIVIGLLDATPEGYRIEPVYLVRTAGQWHHRHARRYTLELLGTPSTVLTDDPIDPQQGDLMLVLDISGDALVQAEQSGLFAGYRNLGVEVYSVVYDLLPIRIPEVFPPGTAVHHANWLRSVSTFDGAVCISRSVAEDLAAWHAEAGVSWQNRRPFCIGWWHLGADVSNSAPSAGLPDNSAAVLSQLGSRPSFLMVGTIEPRKGYLQTIEAFTTLWTEGVDVNLVIVGREGWKDLPEPLRRDIPQTINRIRTHPELNRRLFWLEGVSDEYLEKIYATGTCLIAASYGEGFGLPLIEAAQNMLPIIARRIPVFQEVAGDNVDYFEGMEAKDLFSAIKSWLARNSPENKSNPSSISRLTWEQSTYLLSDILINKNWSYKQHSDQEKQKALRDHLNLIHKARVSLVSTLLPQGEVILDLGGANCPLYKMGYPHKFKKLYLIDLPPEDRCEMYKEIIIDPDCDGGEVIVKYEDMTQLDAFSAGSVDFVWSGQSIEHVPYDEARKMCKEAYRVLKPGGSFCLDTPNRLITKIHTQDIGGGFIHPEHCFEYEPNQLHKILEEAGFTIKDIKGVCEMQSSAFTHKFDYSDFLYGEHITKNVESSYIQYFHCIKTLSI